MRRLIDPLMVLVLILMAGYLILAGDQEKSTSALAVPASSGTEAGASPATARPTDTSVPTDVPTATLIPASVTVPTKTSTPRPTLPPTATPTVTPTVGPTLTRTPTHSAVEQEISDGVARGNRIVQAIEAYHNAQGQYPPSLDALVPGYLSGIPLTETGRPFFYRLFDGTGPMATEVYWVAFKLDSRDHVTCTYLRRLDYWDCDFASP